MQGDSPRAKALRDIKKTINLEPKPIEGADSFRKVGNFKFNNPKQETTKRANNYLE